MIIEAFQQNFQSLILIGILFNYFIMSNYRRNIEFLLGMIVLLSIKIYCVKKFNYKKLNL